MDMGGPNDERPSTTPDCRNTPSNIDIEEEEIVDDLRNDGNSSMPEQFRRPNPWKKMMMMIIIIYVLILT